MQSYLYRISWGYWKSRTANHRKHRKTRIISSGRQVENKSSDILFSCQHSKRTAGQIMKLNYKNAIFATLTFWRNHVGRHKNENLKKKHLSKKVCFQKSVISFQGIELSNYLIKQAASLVKNEFPLISQFSTLSPVPNFRPWLLEKLKAGDDK